MRRRTYTKDLEIAAEPEMFDHAIEVLACQGVAREDLLNMSAEDILWLLLDTGRRGVPGLKVIERTH